MNETLKALKIEALNSIKEVKTLEELENVRLSYLSKKGHISLMMSKLRDLPNEERPAFGQMVNAVKQDVELALYDKKQVLEEEALLKTLQNEHIDVTLPG